MKRNDFLHSQSNCREKSDPELDLDPLVRGTDTGIRIRTKMSRIPKFISVKKFLRRKSSQK
jgi:hypothetical protein